MDRLTELKNRYEDNKTAIKRLTNENESIEVDIVRLEFGVEKGVIVLDSKGNRYSVVSVRRWSSGRPWVTGCPFKKDGGVSKVVRALYTDWTVERSDESD
jgi:hypothetical protein